MNRAADIPSIRVRLRKGREKPFVTGGHPWVMSGAVDREDGPADAPLARVETAAGDLVGVGFYSPRSQIRVRLLGRDTGPVDREFLARRLRAAHDMRRALVPPDTTGYRVLNAEGDGVPGWTVDRYGDTLVCQVTVAGLEALKAEAHAALREVFPDHAILQANDVPARRGEGLSKEDDVVAPGGGETLPEEAVFLESGLPFRAELRQGQKTGFYLDQRDNRRRVETLASGRRVLDLFAHTGAFARYAQRGGARSVTCVESAGRLVERGRRALPEATWIEANVFEHLRSDEARYDLVIADPPPLVKRRKDVKAGARAYKDLNRLALGRLDEGGLLLTFSCSGAVDGKLFRQLLFQASREAGVELQLLAPLSAGADHPVAVTHPEGEYLVGWLARVARR